MTSAERRRASRLRQEINALWRRMGALLGEVERRDPLVKGTLYERRRRCGRVGCRCARGLLHVSEGFSCSERGRTRHVPVRQMDQGRLRDCVKGYGRFRAARAELSKTWRALLDLVDEMESLRRVRVEDFLNPSRAQLKLLKEE